MSSLAILEDRVNTQLADVQAKLAVRDELRKQLADLDADVIRFTQSVEMSEEAAVVIGAVEKTQQDQLKQKLEKLVSYALTVIFERPYQFLVDFETRGQQSEARFMVVDERGSSQGLKDAHGGGIMVVVAYILRAIVMMSSQPRLMPLMVDDEPLIQVSSEFRPRLTEFLKKFAKSAGVQLIIVTHEDDYTEMADKCYKFRLRNGATEVTCVK